jgi:hypothetical protein
VVRSNPLVELLYGITSLAQSGVESPELGIKSGGKLLVSLVDDALERRQEGWKSHVGVDRYGGAGAAGGGRDWSWVGNVIE